MHKVKTIHELEDEVKQTKLMALKAYDRLHPFVKADMPSDITSWFKAIKKEVG